MIGHMQHRLTKLETDIKESKARSVEVRDLTQICRLEKEFNSFWGDEEIMWGQRSRQLWLKHSDQSSRFSHEKANQCFKKNTVVGI